MTVSALDDLAPGRITVTLGSAIPLRLGQMGIGYDPDEAIARTETAIGELRRLWRGERLAPGAAGLPDIEPMFPPVHHVPIWVAGYRRAFHELAGRAADGYLARPAESVEGVRLAARRIAAAATAAGRAPADVAIGGYLLTLVDTSRRAALDRAKREPFVIYMLSVQSDLAMRRTGLDPRLCAGIAAAWRAEDYHGAAALIPDELVDAFLLCGTAAEVAERVEDYADAGMGSPVLQPVLQTDAQIEGVLDAAARYAGARGADPVPARRESAAAASRGPEHIPLRRRVGGLVEIARPFSLTASLVPVAAAGALALAAGRMHWPLFVIALVAGALLQVGTNVVNEVYDVRAGIDSITSPRASRALVTGRLRERGAFALAAASFALCAGLGMVLVTHRGWPLAVIGAAGLVGGWGYTAPPLQYKYRALGLPLVFVLMGPLMVVGGYYAVTGAWSTNALVASVPIGLLVTAILHGNEWRDIREDTRAGIVTLSSRIGREWAHYGYLGLTLGAYIVLALAVVVGALPPATLLAILSLPLLVVVVRAAELGASGQARAIAMIDLQTARLHAAFGLLLVAGVVLAALVH
jgi:1,4-dihydroxy-2-naphthoate octaprenyltransferase